MFHFAQFNAVVGDVAGNAARILHAAKAAPRDAVVLCPELAICGYPPEDLILREDFVAACMREAQALAQALKDGPPVLLGSPWREGGNTYNTALLLHEGKTTCVHRKMELPNYGMFDEKRLFTQGERATPITLHGRTLGVMICEDAWHARVPAQLAAQGAQTLAVLNASPFEQGKPARRLELAHDIATTHGLDVAYVNLVGGQDDVVFDGGSFLLDANGETLVQLPFFEEENAAQGFARALEEPEALWKAARLALRDYVRKNGFTRVLLGLSGGIDSAVAASLCVDALGAENVLGVLMPSPYSSVGSVDDARASARMLGIETHTLPIQPAMECYAAMLTPAMGEGWMEKVHVGGNLQARIRGQILMALSNQSGRMLVNTSNKSEVAVGYSTLYGDACGGYAPLKDIYKTDIYRLAHWRNQQGMAIPHASIDKPPSAELAPGQRDDDQLPPYDILDAALRQHIEGNLSVEAMVAAGTDKAVATRVATLVRQAEYKRRQMPPGARVSGMMFGRDWRMPLSNGWKF